VGSTTPRIRQLARQCPRSATYIRLSEPISRGTVTGQRNSTTRLRGQLSRRVAAGLQPKRKRNGEAIGVRRGDEFFRVGTLFVFKPGPKRGRRLSQYSRIGGKMTGAGATGPAPNRFRLADHLNLR
jgi:hypothetical protein